MRRRLILFALTLAALVSLLSVGPVLAKAKPGCPTDKPLVVDVTLAVANLDDVGVTGNVWALDTYVDHIRIWQVGSNFYCIRSDAIGTFTSFAGTSPGGSGTIGAGVTGSLSGTQFYKIAGIFEPISPTSGDIGFVNAGCDQQGVCQDLNYRFTRHYFSRVNAIQFGWYEATYDGGSNGTFLQSTDGGNTGDITGT